MVLSTMRLARSVDRGATYVLLTHVIPDLHALRVLDTLQYIVARAVACNAVSILFLVSLACSAMRLLCPSNADITFPQIFPSIPCPRTRRAPGVDSNPVRSVPP